MLTLKKFAVNRIYTCSLRLTGNLTLFFVSTKSVQD